ncbi:bifunctional dethiobiotin synthetase / adenosylmethionine---8-amino-7-oxononanoate aminotransferase [Marchantia polymorpha subsp. ruderalis]
MMSRFALLFRRSLSGYDCDRVGLQVRKVRCTSQTRHLSQQRAGEECCGTDDSSPATRKVSVATRGVNLSHPTFVVWGANTGVGKTLLSAGLLGSILSSRKARSRDVMYLKPVQTGYPADSDARFVTREVSNILRSSPHGIQNKVYICNHTLKASPAVHWAVKSKEETGMKDLGSYEELILEGSQRPNFYMNGHDNLEADSQGRSTESFSSALASLPSQLTCKTMLAWFDPVSPHYAAQTERTLVDDSYVIHSIQSALESHNIGYINDGSRCEAGEESRAEKWVLIETAGGVASPGPSGTLQCDLYRPLRLPAVLMGDGHLGGISSTISAYESLHSRGYDVGAVVLSDYGLDNEKPLLKYLQGRVPVFVLPPVPDISKGLSDWFDESQVCFSQIRYALEESHLRRIQRLHEMPRKAEQILWWPFTQHTMVPTGEITLIDSRCGENFSVFKSTDGDRLESQFDACASWWTQGPDMHLQPELAREAAYAAGRYGHVMFPENVHEPALRCAELLLEGVGQGWARRVFFSDTGSAAIEIALKMAFRKFVKDHASFFSADTSWKSVESQPSLKVLALSGSYHGDTLGAMEAQAPNPYTGFLQQPWYSGRGLFLDSPKVYMQMGQWQLDIPDSLLKDNAVKVKHADTVFDSRDDVFSATRDQTNLAETYRAYVDNQLSVHKAKEVKNVIAALIIEPVIHGAGGMEMVDPLFQRVLVSVCRNRNVPVIFDEIFAGCWRFGVQSTSELLNCYPDIACYAKLLTGGTVPLAVTLATEDVFESFKGLSKLDALLHGHSYTAHAMGCATAVAALQYFKDPSKNTNLLPSGRLLELWEPELVAAISCHRSVKRVTTIGTLFACELQDKDSGYASTSTKGLIQSLRANGIFARPLGNVVYFLCGPLTAPASCKILLQVLESHLSREMEQIKN